MIFMRYFLPTVLLTPYATSSETLEIA